MKQIRVVFCIYVLLGVIAIMAGCNAQNAEEKNTSLALIKKTDPKPVTLVSHNKKEKSVSDLEEHVESFDEIYDVAVIRGKKETLIVYKVKHMQRFRMKDIEKKLKCYAGEKYPIENFIVSSDYKIFLEAVKLSKKMDDPNFSEEKGE